MGAQARPATRQAVFRLVLALLFLRRCHPSFWAMAEQTKTEKVPGRKARLRAALRENLRRRKAQARGRATRPPEGAATPDLKARDQGSGR